MGTCGCDNTELSKQYIDGWIVERLSEYVFSDKYAPKITEEYNQYISKLSRNSNSKHDSCMTRLKELESDISRTVSLLLKTSSNVLISKLRELEVQKAQIELTLAELKRNSREESFTETEISSVLARIRELLCNGTLDTLKMIIDRFVSQIVVSPDGVVVHFNFFPGFTIRPDEQIENDCPLTERESDVQEQSISSSIIKMADDGGTGGLAPASSTISGEEQCLIVSIPRGNKSVSLRYAHNLQTILAGS